MHRFLILFVVLLLGLFTVELLQPVQTHLVIPWTALLAKISAGLASFFDGNVVSEGKVMRDAITGHGVSIEAGCNGVEAVLLLAAAVIAYPSSIKLKALGIGVGFFAIQTVNLVRIITLYYMAGWSPKVFEFFHLYLWQALIMLDVLVVWLIWLKQVGKEEARKDQNKNDKGTGGGHVVAA